MIEQTVVSCPRCLRQYRIESGTERLVAQCSICKAHFIIVIPKLTGQVEDALVLEGELEPSFAFFQDACETMARNASDLMTLVSRHIAVEDVLAIVKSLPKCRESLASDEWRTGTLGRALAIAHERALTEHEKRRRDELRDYFLDYLPNRSLLALQMLQAAFAGVLGGIDWTEAGQERIVVLSEAPKPQERWWWKKG